MKRVLMILIWTVGVYYAGGIVLSSICGIVGGIASVVCHQLHYDMGGYIRTHHSSLLWVGSVFRICCLLLAAAAFILAWRGRLPGTKTGHEPLAQPRVNQSGPFMRVMFMIVWAVAFFVGTLVIGSILLPAISKLEGWGFPPPLKVGIVWAVICFGSPLVALSLGSRGLLPGTKKPSRNRQTNHA
jgi:hypothetical protein